MDSETITDHIAYHQTLSNSLSNTALLLSESSRIYAKSLEEFIKAADKQTAVEYVKLCSNNLNCAKSQLEGAIYMLNINEYATWTAIRSYNIEDDYENIDENEFQQSNQIESEQIESEQIESEQIESEQIESESIESESIRSDQIESEQIESEPIEPEPIESEPIESEPIDTNQIESEPIKTDQTESEQIESEQIESKPIESEQIESEQIETDQTESEPIETNQTESEPIKQSESIKSKYMSLESSDYFKNKDIDTSTFNKCIIKRHVDIDKLQKFDKGLPDGNTAYLFWQLCWDKYTATFQWDIKTSTIKITADSELDLNNCMYDIAVIFENIE